ncbi:MAG: TIGR00300 family protein, partial [Nitrospiraceae bacterium]
MGLAQETILLHGHIIDSLILAKVMDTIHMMGGTFDLSDVQIGATREEPSRAKIVVRAPSGPLLVEILDAIQPHGATVERESNCTVEPAPADGILPDTFYATSHLPTHVRLEGRWVEVETIEMDLAIRTNPESTIARAVPMSAVKKGDPIVTGRDGIRVIPLQRPRERDVFAFMEAHVSSERPHGPLIADIARRMRTLHDHDDGKVLLSGGPAIIHSGGREAAAWLIESGFIQVLFCGNALAAHDME